MGTVKGSPLFLLVTTSVFLITALHSVQAQNTGYHLIGPGACRGPDWGDDEWPLAVGDRTLEKCSEKCHQTEDCTSFSLGKGEKAKKPCLLYGHEDIQPASSLGGECYKIANGPPKKNGNEEDDDDDDDDKKETEVKKPQGKPKEEKKVKKAEKKPDSPPPPAAEKKVEAKPEEKETKPEAKKEPEVKKSDEKKKENPPEKPKETPP